MSKELDFTGKSVLVVGGSSGIGRSISHAFRERGARIHVTGTRVSKREYDTKDTDWSGISYSQLDVATASQIEKDAPNFDALDVLVLSQGQVLYHRQEFEAEGWEKVIAVNLNSLMHLARRYRPALAATRGAIVIVGSLSGFMSNRGNPAYAASKAGAVSLTKTLGEAWAKEGIRVNAIAPGFVETKMTVATFGDAARRETTLGRIPLARLGLPAEMANAVLFLASPLASYIIGQTVIVDGGLGLS